MIEPGLTQSIHTFHQDGLIDDPQIMQTKVLVIDDDSDTTDLLRIILEPNAFEVITANTGEEGVELVRSATPDVVVVDLLMPGMDGLNVLRAIRLFSTIPVLVLSAVNKPNIAAQALNSGADDFLIKPMSSSVLIASLNMLARRARVERQAKADGSRKNGGSDSGNGAEDPPL